MVFYEGSCAFHLAPAKVPAAARDLGPSVTWQQRPISIWSVPRRLDGRLPNGEAIPEAAIASGSVYDDSGAKPFLAMALMPLWRLAPVGGRQSLSAQFLTIALHELTHTTQLPSLMRRIEDNPSFAGEDLSLNDDAVQAAFEADPEYSRAFRAELEVLGAATRATNVTEKKALARSALDMSRRRQARFFVGPHARFVTLEPLFLSMEGLAEWLRYTVIVQKQSLPDHRRLAALDADFDNYAAFRRMTTAQAATFVLGSRRYWVQEHGFLLFLLLSQLSPACLDAVIPTDLASPVSLLESALARDAGWRSQSPGLGQRRPVISSGPIQRKWRKAKT